VHEAEWGAGGNLIFTTTEGLRATQLLRLRAGSAIETIPLRVKEDGHIAIHPSGAGAVIVRDISPRGGTVWSIDPTSPKIQPNRLTAPPPLNGSTVLDGCASPEGLLLLVERNSARNAVWVSRPGGKAQELPMNGEEAHISGIRCFQQHAVLFGRAENRGALWLVSLGGGAPTVSRIAAPFGLTALTLGAHPSPDVSTVRVQLSSLINPPLLYELDLTTGSFAPKAQMEVARHSAGEYTIAHLSARAPDGVAIPITVAYRVDIERSGTRPVVLSTYGAYGANASTEFDPFYLPLLERGFVVAVAHIRGGGEGGPGWHAAGRGRDKRVSTTDLIACAEALVKLGWGADRRIALIGRSAGAIPAAGAAALRSDLIGAVILDAPFLDVVGALSDPSRPLAVRDRAEWGDPNDPIIRETMRRYAPFDLALTPSYPPTLITTGINDAAVSPLEAARWIEHLERAGSTGHLISISAGSHSGPPTRVEATNEAALRAVFILSKLGSADRN
jgi:oligopeptidase B